MHLEIGYPDVEKDLNRWMPIVKWFLAIPHYIVLAFLAFGGDSVPSWLRPKQLGSPRGIAFVPGLPARVEAYARRRASRTRRIVAGVTTAPTPARLVQFPTLHCITRTASAALHSARVMLAALPTGQMAEGTDRSKMEVCR